MIPPLKAVNRTENSSEIIDKNGRIVAHVYDKDLAEFMTRMDDPTVVYPNLLRGFIGLTKAQALSYAGVDPTALETVTAERDAMREALEQILAEDDPSVMDAIALNTLNKYTQPKGDGDEPR